MQGLIENWQETKKVITYCNEKSKLKEYSKNIKTKRSKTKNKPNEYLIAIKKLRAKRLKARNRPNKYLVKRKLND